MSEANKTLVSEFCHHLASGGGTAKLVEYLADDVVYHNIPWEPVTGHDGVRQVLGPFLDVAPAACTKMEILSTVAEGDTVMNARSEVWERGDIELVLPVAGVFRVRDGKITHWSDYFDVATIQPLLDTM